MSSFFFFVQFRCTKHQSYTCRSGQLYKTDGLWYSAEYSTFSVYWFILFACLFIFVFVCLLACLFVYSCVCLFVLFVCLLVCLFVCFLVGLLACLFVCSYICRGQIHKTDSLWYSAEYSTLSIYWFIYLVCLFVCLSVCGTRLNILRSLSVMRSVTISWRWTATAETPAMLWRCQRQQTSILSGWCSVLPTTTTISRPLPVHRRTSAAGGSIAVLRAL